MNTSNHRTTAMPRRCLFSVTLATALGMPWIGLAQPADPNHQGHQHPTTAPIDKPLAEQVGELRVKVAKLEMAMQQKQMGMAGSMPGMGAGAQSGGARMQPGGRQPMGQMGGMSKGMSGGAAGMSGGQGGGMGMMMDMDRMQMGGMSGGGAGMSGGAPASSAGMGMGMMDMDDQMEMAGMMGMAPMGGGGAMGAMPQSALPGFPGSSHLYHIGATGFFLDHPQHITLTTEQQAALNKAKEQALLTNASADRAIEQAEQDLWTLTAADQPDVTKIAAKTEEIGKLNSDQRLAFIRAVGEASKILTDDQRKILTGFAPPAPTPAPAPPAMPAGGMKDM